MNRSLWRRQEVETGITKSKRENSCSCLISYTFHRTALISIYTEMQKIILCDWSTKFLKRSPVWREIYSIWCITFLQMYARKFKIYFRVYKAYKRVLLEPLFKVNIQKFVLLNHSCVKLTTNRFLLTSFFFLPSYNSDGIQSCRLIHSQCLESYWDRLLILNVHVVRYSSN